MHVAQGLYERGLITYMRTDSTSLSAQAVSAARNQIRAMYGDAYLPDQPREYRSKVKNAQEAHEAIRPAGDAMRTVEDVARQLSGTDERRLYDLIWKRTVASQMADARIRRVTLRLRATSTAGEDATFQATGRTIEFPGYLRAYVEGADDPDAELEDRETLLPPLEEGASVGCRELRPSGHTTQPPARYTEASLVKELEERGIGRPSTYASVIETILRRDYVFKKGSALVPTWTAFAKVQLLERYFSHLIDYEFTAVMEEALDAIARGEGEAEKWLHSFYFGNGEIGLRDLVAEEHIAQIDKAEVNAVHIGTDGDGQELIVRVWPNGANIERGDEKGPIPAELAPDELTPERAEELLAIPSGPREVGTDPDTGLTVLVLTGRFGPFVQLGEQAPGSKEKPKRASLFASMDPTTVTLEQALALLSLPRVVGTDDDGQEITAQNGRYGAYLKKGTDSRSLASEDALFSTTMEEARAIFAQPKQRRGRVAKPPLAELGAHPESGAPVRVLDGRFGPYITDGTVNASVPRGTDPDQVTLDEAVELLRERAARAPATKKKAPAKRAVKKATPPTSTTTRTIKKRAAKKTTAKKAATKSTRKATKPPAPGT
jgi:DNA topoisomerase-1